MTHLIYAAFNCVHPTIIRQKGSLSYLTAWISLPHHLGKCWQIILWRIK